MRPGLARRLQVLAAALVAAAGPLALARAGDDPAARATPEAALRLQLAAGPAARDPNGVRAWAAAMAAQGRARSGTVLGGDLLAGAAAATAGALDDPAAALLLWRESAAAYPPSVPEAGFAWFEQAAILARAGEPAPALAALDTAQAIANRGDGVDADAGEVERRARLRERLDGIGRAWRVQLLETLGRRQEAIDLLEEAAKAAHGRLGADLAWERVAVAAWRAEDLTRSREAIQRALEAATLDERIVRLEQWALLARHDLLDAQGDGRLSAVWPGDAFLEDLRATLARVEGRRGAQALALQLAAIAWTAGRAHEALELYEFAFRDPAFAEAARESALQRQRLVTAAWVALGADDPEQARDWLLFAISCAGGAMPGTESLRLRIDEALAARDGAAQGSGSKGPDPTPDPTAPEALPRGGAGFAPLALAPAEEEATAPPEGEVEVGPREGSTGALVGGLLVLAAGLMGLLWRRGRRRRP